MRILLDAMGGDNAPDANIKGAVKAIDQIEAEVILIGKEEVIRARLRKCYEYFEKQGLTDSEIINITKLDCELR